MATSSQSPHGMGLRIAIGIDFGTTFSGAAVRSSHFANSLRGWLSSRLQGDLGYSTDFHLKRLDDARRLWVQHNTTATALTVDYLKSLWRATLDHVIGAGRITKEQIVGLTLHVAIGVPANSKPETLARFKGAVEAAGIPACAGHRHLLSTVEFCMEPEAAALAYIEVTGSLSDLTSGGIITICDCGGATADAISYDITSTEPLALEECVPGDARFCGLVLLDGLFRERLEEKIREAVGPSAPSDISIWTRHLYRLMWRRLIKPDFDGSSGPYSEPIATGRRGKRQCTRSADVTFTSDELKALFDPTIGKIVDLVRNQVEAAWQKRHKLPKYLIVCGGFSGSRYLGIQLSAEINRLNNEYSQEHPIRIETATRIER
ncbi:hypothetical protein MFIFM68171_09041 [Madurella fahalii]|uniref:Uncharacterized protein n=1 Tax=Madurella fahalii TaxID=1157608 RepID=A0ABQ0GM78_9PEZI